MATPGSPKNTEMVTNFISIGCIGILLFYLFFFGVTITSTNHESSDVYNIYILDGFTNREGPGDEDLPGHRGRWKIAYKQWERYRTIHIYI